MPPLDLIKSLNYSLDVAFNTLTQYINFNMCFLSVGRELCRAVLLTHGLTPLHEQVSASIPRYNLYNLAMGSLTSARIVLKAQMSLEKPHFPKNCSGAIQIQVPMLSAVTVSLSPWRSLPCPRSEILQSPSSKIRTLGDFKSKWQIPLLCSE